MRGKLYPFFLLSLLVFSFFAQTIVKDVYAQVISGEPNGSVSLNPGDIFEVGLKMKKGASVEYSLNADNVLLFDIHVHIGNEVITHVVRESKTFEDVFAAPNDGDYYFLAMNLGGSAVTWKYDIFFAHDAQIVQFEGAQYSIMTSSNSDVKIVGFNQENKQLSIRVETPYLTPGFADITIPRVLIDEPFNVQGSLTDYKYTQDNSTSTFAIKTSFGTHDISITGTHPIPELPFPLLVMAATMVSFLLLVKFRLKKL